MFDRQIRRLYDHLYAHAAVKTPAAIGAEIGKLLHTALFLETVKDVRPAFAISIRVSTASTLRAAFTRMNTAWAFYPAPTQIDLTDFDIVYANGCLADILISDPRHDYFGDASEISRSDWAKQAGGQFFTDQYVTRLAMVLLQFDPREGDDLVDICAGTGGFLLAVLRSSYGQNYLARGIFGSVIDEITPAYVGQMPVPPPEAATADDVVRAVREAEAGRNRAMAGFAGAAALIDQAVALKSGALNLL